MEICTSNIYWLYPANKEMFIVAKIQMSS